MLAIEIKIDEVSLKEAQNVLRAIPGGYDRVIKRATGRAIDQAYTKYKRAISRATTLKPTVAGKAMTKKKYKTGAALLADPVRAPLGMFEAKQIKLIKGAKRKIRRGLASRVGGGLGVRYRIGRVQKMVEGGFIAKLVGKKGGASGDLHTTGAQRRAEWEAEGLTPAQVRKKSHRGVYKRIGSSRLPVYESMGPSIWQVIVNTPGMSEQIPKQVAVDFNKLVNNQMGVELRRWRN